MRPVSEKPTEKEYTLKKILVLLASVAMVCGLVASSQANATVGATTTAPRAIQATQDANVPAQLKSGERLSKQDMRSLGFKPLKGKKLARVKRINAKTSAQRQTSTVGAYYYGTYRYTGYAWYDLRYSYSFVNSSYYYLYYYYNWKICTTSGTGCIAANAYHYKYYIYYYGTWYGAYGLYGPYAG
jgi:hypothetical protein